MDTETEATGSNAEYFWFDLYKSKADADDFNYSAWAKGHIIDDATLSLGLSNYTYSVTGANNTSSNAAKEGEDVTFTITRTKTDAGQNDAASTIFVSTSDATAYSDDYTALNLQEVKFKKTETSKVITVKTKKTVKQKVMNISGLMFLNSRQTPKIIILLLMIKDISQMMLVQSLQRQIIPTQ